ncbi:MAG: T9SS type A sorting domain-containing protein [Ignavibacteriota bacterium]|jgi:hypothetical protein|nr:T9SS type A sorting domain-containing protein [Ignavibacteriales bacterium]MBL1122947.1 T9SS C-terminal target domain-containing protein [Ignavibacteriota bacterium]MCZ7615312.1 C25 family cysteine peptidase [Ignavibacteriaceae bacterium]QKJ95804.1 MAG: T9SS type A sorting domain-containing protein [Ignavibacteriota bacterium]GJQ41897.1 MAG: hypothetical protein JETCAE03_13950 [Ignavibacteriaceae bacterium]
MKSITFFLLLISFSALYSQSITLRDTTNQYDYIIITIPEFVNACEPFRQHKETVRDFRTLIVDTTQIFAEFDSSAAPQDNFRDFISFAGTFWEEPKPKYYLLVGNLNKLPNFEDILQFGSIIDTAYTDYYYSLNKYSSDTTISIFSIGRVPAIDIDELSNYFGKVISYELDTLFMPWMNRNLFVYHDYDSSYISLFRETTFHIIENYPEYFSNHIYYTDSDTSAYYGNKDSIINFINVKGTNSLWLIGNTKNTQFGYENILDTGDVQLFNNNPANFITFFYLRQFFNSDNFAQGFADKLLLDNEASVAVCAPVGLVFAGQYGSILINLSNYLFGSDRNCIGESINYIRNLYSPPGYTIRVCNLWGDPSLFPKYETTAGSEFIYQVPQNFVLHQNYPNPFNPTTTIKFALPIESKVKINVYNSLGQLVETIMDKEMESGYHEVNFNASRLASGVYLYQLQAQDYVSVKKMILMK